MSGMYITYRLGDIPYGERAPEKTPILKFWVNEEEFSIDLEVLAEALKPFLEEKELTE